MTKGPTVTVAALSRNVQTEAEGNTEQLSPWDVQPIRVSPVARPVPAIVAAGDAALDPVRRTTCVKSSFPLNTAALKFCNVAA